MSIQQPARLLAASLLCVAANASWAEVEFSGKIDLEATVFSESASQAQQKDHNLSVLIQPQWVWQDDAQNNLVQFSPMLRIDQHDGERSHGDIRELYWIYVQENWELRTGLRKEFWGVTEFQHLVDVINQTDLVENVSGEEKLGQPMLNLSLTRDSGIWDFYLLPSFRERTFASIEGRPSYGLNVSKNATYESSDKDRHLDAAIRWSQNYDWLDLSLSAFHGTNRDPILKPAVENGQTVFVPHYEQMTQLGSTVQAIQGDWLLKLELIYRDSTSAQYGALQTGFEYTLYGITESGIDLGLISEYGWDERGQSATGLMQNDLFAGLRFAFNDEAGTEILAGIGQDLDYDTLSVSAEASQRLSNDWKISGEMRVVDAHNKSDPLYHFRQDDYVKGTLSWYF